MNRTRLPLPYTDYHKDGSLRVTGQTLNSLAEGYWEWFRSNGTVARSGYFRGGIQVGEWITYDQQGTVYKITDLKAGNPDLPLTSIALMRDSKPDSRSEPI